MSSSVKLGIFWGNNSFSVVESNQDAPQKTFRVLHQPAPEFDPVSPVNGDDVQFVNPLKEALKLNNIKSTEMSLALPSKDIVIRSLVIPQVKAGELNNVVEFEIKRYIPFNLKDLYHTFHAVKFVEDKNKLMRVHFVAIRREILDRYKLLFRQAGLNVVYSEPAPMSLIRALVARKLIRVDQKVAVILTDLTDSGVIIVDKGIVHFVRDFQLQNPTLNMAPLDLDTLRKKLINEVKVSIDFYTRQLKSESISELYTLSFSSEEDLTEILHKELELPVKKISSQAIGKFSITADAGMVSSHGINLRSSIKGVEFNLSKINLAPSQTVSFQSQIPEEFLPVLKVGVVCFALLAGVFFLTKAHVANVKKQYQAQAERQGAFLNMTKDEIEAKIKEQKEKLSNYQHAYKKSEMAYLMTYIAKTLPAGIWLSDFDISYDRPKETSASSASSKKPAVESVPGQKPEFPIIIDLSGFSYAKDPNEQFKMVYGLVNSLKSDKTLMKYSRSVNLAGIQREENGDAVITSFKIQIK